MTQDLFWKEGRKEGSEAVGVGLAPAPDQEVGAGTEARARLHDRPDVPDRPSAMVAPVGVPTGDRGT